MMKKSGCFLSRSASCKTNYLFGIVFISTLIWNTQTQAQQLSPKKLHQSKTHLEKVERISVDRLGGIYLSSSCGLEKFDPDGYEQEKKKFNECTPTEVLEAWNPFRIYGFQKSIRSFLVFDQSLSITEKIMIDSALAIEPLLATPASDNRSYWLLDIDFSIKKIDLYNSRVLFETEPIFDPSQSYRFTHMREFQNFLFLLDDQKAIYVLNSVGKLVKKMDALGASYFSVLGEDIYYLSNGQVNFFDIYTEESYRVDVPDDTDFVVATDEKMILIKDKLLEVFQFTPRK